jgi:hypothetical protein
MSIVGHSWLFMALSVSVHVMRAQCMRMQLHATAACRALVRKRAHLVALLWRSHAQYVQALWR